VSNPEEKIPELLEFCGLDWEPACLEQDKLKRFVSTPSQIQVRQPMYQSSIGRWQHYRPWLESLFGIDDLIEDYENSGSRKKEI